MDKMIKQNPLVSFIVPCYKTSPKRLIELIYSVLIQDYDNWELILKDDSPSEEDLWNTLKIMKEGFCNDKIKTYRILPVSNGVIGKTKHDAFKIANGDILVELDHDDLLMKNCASSLVEAYHKYPKRCFYYSDYIPVNEDIPRFSEILAKWNLLFVQTLEHPLYNFNKSTLKNVNVFRTPPVTYESLKNVFFPAHVRAWRSDFYHKICGHDDNCPIADDNDIILRSYIYTDFVQIARPLYIWRFSDDTTSMKWSHEETMYYINNIFNKYNDMLIEEYNSSKENKVVLMF